MTTRQFFFDLEKANAFKKIIHEGGYRVDVMTDESVYRRKLFTVSTYKEFKDLLIDNLHPDALPQILNSDIVPTATYRAFKIYYTFDGEEYYLELFVD